METSKFFFYSEEERTRREYSGNQLEIISKLLSVLEVPHTYHKECPLGNE